MADTVAYWRIYMFRREYTRRFGSLSETREAAHAIPACYCPTFRGYNSVGNIVAEIIA